MHHLVKSLLKNIVKIVWVIAFSGAAACQSGSGHGSGEAPKATEHATQSGPQVPDDTAVIDALKPCMRVGRVFARLPTSDRVEEVMDACAGLLRPKCKARFLEPPSLDGVLGSCATDYCPDLPPTFPLCTALAVGRNPKNAEIVAFFEAILRRDYPDQRQGLDILAGMLTSALLEKAPPAQ